MFFGILAFLVFPFGTPPFLSPFYNLFVLLSLPDSFFHSHFHCSRTFRSFITHVCDTSPLPAEELLSLSVSASAGISELLAGVKDAPHLGVDAAAV